MHNGFIHKQNPQTKVDFDEISQWTRNKKMKLSHKKYSLICFNFTNKYQFTTRVTMEGNTLPIVQQTKLLGVIITNDINYMDTKYIIKDGIATQTGSV